MDGPLSSSRRKSRRVTFAPGTTSPEPRINWKKLEALHKQLLEAPPSTSTRIMDQDIMLYLQSTGALRGQLQQDGDKMLYTVSGNIDHIREVAIVDDNDFNFPPGQSVVKIEIDGVVTNCVEGTIENVGPGRPIHVRGQIRRITKIHHLLPPPSPRPSSADSGRGSEGSDSGDCHQPSTKEPSIPEAAGEDSSGSGSTSGVSSSTSGNVKNCAVGFESLKQFSAIVALFIMSSLIISLAANVGSGESDVVGYNDDAYLNFNFQVFGYQVELTLSISPTKTSSIYKHGDCEGDKNFVKLGDRDRKDELNKTNGEWKVGSNFINKLLIR